MASLYRALLSIMVVASLSACSVIPISEIKMQSSVLAKKVVRTDTGSLSVTEFSEIFKLDEMVYLYTMVRWAEVGQNAGLHSVKWEWYSKDELISKFEGNYNFYSTPFQLVGNIPALSLGEGKHRVKLFIDGVEFSEKEIIVEP